MHTASRAHYEFLTAAVALTGMLLLSSCLSQSPDTCQATGTALIPATAAYDQGRYEDARVIAAAALNAASARNDSQGELNALHLVTQAMWKQAKNEDAERYARRALELAQEKKNECAQGRAQIDLGDIYERRKDHDAAIAAYKSALVLLQAPENWEQRARANQQLGDIYVSHGAFEEALNAYRAALTDAERFGMPMQIALASDYMGFVMRRLGDCETASRYHQAALKTTERIIVATERDKAVARANNHLGLCDEAEALDAVNAGDAGVAREKFRTAAAYERTAIEAANRAHDRWRLGYARRALAAMLREASELETGEARTELLDQAYSSASIAMAEAIEMREPEWQGLALHESAIVLARLGRYDEARQSLSQAKNIWQVIGDRYSEGFAYLAEAEEIDERVEHHHAAVVHYDRAIALLRTTNAHEHISVALYRKGLVQEREGNLEAARQSYLDSIETLESLRNRLTLPEHQQDFFAKHQKPYEALIGLLSKLYRRSGSIGDGELAFRVSEQARARALLEMINRGKSQIRAGIDDNTRGRERKLHFQYISLSQELAANRDPRQAVQLRRKLNTLQEQYSLFEQELRKRYPRYAELAAPAPVGVADVQAYVLRPREVLLEYFVGETHTYVFVVNRQGLRAIHTIRIGRNELSRRVTELRHPFELVKTTGAIASLDKFDAGAAHDLYNRLLAPIHPYLRGASKVWVVPHGPLYYLPLELLVSSEKKASLRAKTLLGRFENYTYFLEAAPPLAYALSASLLDSRLAPVASPKTANFLGFGNPVVKAKPAAGAPAPDTARGMNLSPLPFATEEVRQAQRLYAANARIYLGIDATKAQFQTNAPLYNFILLSTHGLLDEARPMESALVFAKRQGSNDYALLRTYEIFDLKLNARLIVLSACEVGLGQLLDGEGLIGFSRAFLYAGASSIVVTLWSVEDRASSELVVGLFRNLRISQQENADALRNVKVALLRSRRRVGNQTLSLAHPFFWAPFILIEGPTP